MRILSADCRVYDADIVEVISSNTDVGVGLDNFKGPWGSNICCPYRTIQLLKACFPVRQ